MSQKQKQLKVRNSSIELLRIIAMIMIVFHHFAYHGEFEWGTSITIARFWYNFIIMGGKIGVNVFVIISGYYLINDDTKSLGLDKIIKIIGQVFFYSIIMFIIGKVTGVGEFGLKSLAKNFFPITFSRWWFAITYFVLYVFHPFLNKLLHCLEKTLYQRFLFVLVICWSIIPTFTTSPFQSNGLLWFVTLYSIAGYIRLFGLNSKFTVKHYFSFFLIGGIVNYFSSVVFTILGTRWDIFSSHATYFYGQHIITTLLISVSFFMIFTYLEFNSKWINTIASATFGVYLIHDNDIARRYLWIEWFKNAQYKESLFLIPYSIIVVACVYIVCSFVELLRQRIIEKPVMMIIRSYLTKRTIPLEQLYIRLKDFVFGNKNQIAHVSKGMLWYGLQKGFSLLIR